MYRTKNEQTAQALANDHGLSRGFSVADGWFYIGTVDQLKAVWCMDITGPEQCTSCGGMAEANGKCQYGDKP